MGNDEHGATRLTNDFVGRAAQEEPLCATPTARRQDDEIGAGRSSMPEDDFGRCPRAHVDLVIGGSDKPPRNIPERVFGRFSGLCVQVAQPCDGHGAALGDPDELDIYGDGRCMQQTNRTASSERDARLDAFSHGGWNDDETAANLDGVGFLPVRR